MYRLQGDLYDDDEYDETGCDINVSIPDGSSSVQGRAMRESVIARHFSSARH